MKTTLKNNRTEKGTDTLFNDLSGLDIMSMLLGIGDPVGPIILPPEPPK